MGKQKNLVSRIVNLAPLMSKKFILFKEEKRSLPSLLIKVPENIKHVGKYNISRLLKPNSLSPHTCMGMNMCYMSLCWLTIQYFSWICSNFWINVSFGGEGIAFLSQNTVFLLFSSERKMCTCETLGTSHERNWNSLFIPSLGKELSLLSYIRDLQPEHIHNLERRGTAVSMLFVGFSS